ncbi:hypothetical protein ACHAQF_008288 [Verticillium nonalfalfae]
MAHTAAALPKEVILNGPDGAYTYTLSRIDFPVPKLEGKGKAKVGLKRGREPAGHGVQGAAGHKGKQRQREASASSEDERHGVSKRPRQQRRQQQQQPTENVKARQPAKGSLDVRQPAKGNLVRQPAKGNLHMQPPAKGPVRKMVPTRTETHPGPTKTQLPVAKTQLLPAKPLARPTQPRRHDSERPLPSARPPPTRPPPGRPGSSAGPSASPSAGPSAGPSAAAARSPSLSQAPCDHYSISSDASTPSRDLPPPKDEILRVKGQIYRKPQDFCNNQKIACLDIFHEASLACRRATPNQAQERAFLHGLFENGWRSELEPPAAPKLARRQVTRTRREIGIIKEDVLPTQKGKAQSDVRRKGASVFARIRVSDDGRLAWGYSDANNRPVRCQYVAWGTEEEGARAYEEAIAAWDRAEVERVTGFNMELAVYLARLWTAHWTRCGYPTRVPVRHGGAGFAALVSMAELVRR